jgi:hypothetical protein
MVPILQFLLYTIFLGSMYVIFPWIVWEYLQEYHSTYLHIILEIFYPFIMNFAVKICKENIAER